MAAETVAYVASRSSALVALFALACLRVAAGVLDGRGPLRGSCSRSSSSCWPSRPRKRPRRCRSCCCSSTTSSSPDSRTAASGPRLWIHACFLARRPARPARSPARHRQLAPAAGDRPRHVPRSRSGPPSRSTCSGRSSRSTPRFYRHHPPATWPPDALTVGWALRDARRRRAGRSASGAEAPAVVVRGGVPRRRAAPVVVAGLAQRDGRRPPGLSRQPRRRVRRGRSPAPGRAAAARRARGRPVRRARRSRTSGCSPIPCAPGRTRSAGAGRAATRSAPSPSPTPSGAIPAPKRLFVQADQALPENHRYWANLGLYYGETGRSSARCRPCARPSDARPGRPWSATTWASSSLRLGREDEAIAEFEAALTGVPTLAAAVHEPRRGPAAQGTARARAGAARRPACSLREHAARRRTGSFAASAAPAAVTADAASRSPPRSSSTTTAAASSRSPSRASWTRISRGLEVLVVDNDSSDGSAEELERRFGDRIRLVRVTAQPGIRGRQQPRHPAGARPLPRPAQQRRGGRALVRARAGGGRRRPTAGSGWSRPGCSSTRGAT